MAEYETRDYVNDNTNGHLDARVANFKCENPDKNLGCDLDIDGMG